MKLKEIIWKKNDKMINGEWKGAVAGFQPGIFRVIHVHHKIKKTDEYHLLVQIHPIAGNTSHDFIYETLENAQKDAEKILAGHVSLFIETI